MNAPPFRAEHIGSLLRPQALLDGRPADEFIPEAIRWQEELGLEVVTDGEFRRESWRLGFVSKVTGFARSEAFGNVDLQQDDAGNVMRIGAAPLAVTKIRRTGPIVADEVAFSLKHAKAMVKATLPAPSYLHYPRGRRCVDPDVYPDLEQFFDDVVGIYGEEIRSLHAAGGRYLQIDEVAQTLLCDQRLRDAVRARGDDPERLVELYIDLINRSVRRRPAGMTIGVHMCRGNAMGKWIAAGGYERIAEKSFSTLEVDAFFLEFDSERAGGFEPLRFMPKGRKVVLGLVSTKIPLLESKNELKRKIEAASRYVALEDLSISPQCGFASHQKGSGLTFAEQEAKLRLVVETAREVWGRA
jgi:5-methyltetrahydropteroyltriglutamate--homocysteine methyltransferase